jgi:hypothetical protein
MKTQRMISLFSDAPPPEAEASPFLVSLLLHGIIIGAIYVVVTHLPKVVELSPPLRYTVRLLNLEQPRPPAHRLVDPGSAQAGAQVVASPLAPGGRPSAASGPRAMALRIPASQTIVQPDLPPTLLAHNIPIPAVLLWSPENTPAPKLIPPPPAYAAAQPVRPSIEIPNHEQQMADIKISATVFNTQAPSLPPSTTTPLVVKGPEAISQTPQTASKPLGPATPARVMAVSNLELQNGTTALPMVNETAPASVLNVLKAGAGEAPTNGGGNPSSNAGGNGHGLDQGGTSNQSVATVTGGNGGSNVGQGTGPNADAGTGDSGIRRISQPKDGQFGVVVVGTSVDDDDPEITELWSGRLAYSVYLHVGTEKNWILQYSLPRAGDTASAGQAMSLLAPWPYYMERPNTLSSEESDTILVHGFVNSTGRFEKLAVLVPQAFSDGKLLLSSLQQWQFRPAKQNGLSTAVEVLLIIPVADE